jgi:hypothetical protein
MGTGPLISDVLWDQALSWGCYKDKNAGKYHSPMARPAKKNVPFLKKGGLEKWDLPPFLRPDSKRLYLS